MDQKYNARKTEKKWYAHWLSRGYFQADNKSEEKSFTMIMPPPNVTGELHLGHVLQHTITDILIRAKRMQGYDTLWLPGTDHAGIQMQGTMEKKLEKEEGKTRAEIGDQAFLKYIWKWARIYEKSILKQSQALGESADWSRKTFTLDPGPARAVSEEFVRLYNEGLIYKGPYIVHYCTRCLTAITDLELEYKEREGELYYIEYPLSELRIKNQESREEATPSQTVAGASSDQADLESLQGTLQTLVDSLSNLENVSSELDNLGASILTVMENNQANTARIDELEEETKNLNQIVKVVSDAVVIGDLNKFIVLDSASGLEIKSANFSLDREGNVVASGEIKTKIGRVSSETGILELNPGEASDTAPNPKVVVAGDLEIQGKIILGASSLASDEASDTEQYPTIGKAKIAVGETSVVIPNNRVTENSLIYITPTSKTFGEVLYLDSQRAEDETNPDDPEETLSQGFTVAIEKAALEEVEFNWWIIE